jgi:hypothetical protein
MTQLRSGARDSVERKHGAEIFSQDRREASVAESIQEGDQPCPGPAETAVQLAIAPIANFVFLHLLHC